MTMDARTTFLLEIKRKAGLATAAELEVLDNTPVILGDGLAMPRPCATVEDWQARWSGLQGPTAYAPGPHDDDQTDDEPDAAPGAAAAAPPATGPIYTNDGMVLCKPGEEPPPPGKPGYKPIDGTQPKARTLRERFIASRRAGRG